MSNRFVLHAVRGSGASYKVALMMALGGIAHDYESVDMRSGEHKSPGFLAKNRYGQVPALEDREAGLVLNQSASILEYLSEKTGKLAAADEAGRITAREWMYWDFDRLARGVFRPRGAALGFARMSDEIVEHYRAEGVAAFGVLDKHLDGRDWLVGQGPTIADVDIYGVLYFCPQANHDLTPFPHLVAWMKRIEALPGYGTPMDLQPA